MIRGVFSGKGGVGKTTTAINLGLAMKMLGKEVIVVDGDIRNPNLAIQIGQLNYTKTLQDLLERDGSILEATYAHESGLKFVPAHISLRYIRTNPERLKEILEKSPYDILIDSPPGLNSESMSILSCCDDLIIVSQPLLPDITDCMKTIEVARELDKKIVGIILNKRRNRDYELSSQEIEAVTNVPVIAQIPWEEDFLRALKMKKPLISYRPESASSINFMKAASFISGMPYIEPKPSRVSKIFSRIRKILRLKKD